jgi:hypothetical protein
LHRYENVSLRRNVGGGDAERPRPMGHWIDVKLEQAGVNRDAVGAWIEVEAGGQRTVREITVGGGHASGELGPVHVGLGKNDAARVRVPRPDGTLGPWHEVDVDQVVTLDRSDAEGAEAVGAGDVVQSAEATGAAEASGA